MVHITNSKLEICSVTWEITNKCNYKCWYCPEQLHSGTSGWPDLDNSVNFFNRLSNIHKGVHIDLIGGEPTLWPKINNFLDLLNNNISIEVTTNGSRTLRWWETLSNKVTRVTLSVHLDSADPNHIIGICKILKNKANLSVLMLYDIKHKLVIADLSKNLKQLDVEHYLKPLYPNFNQVLFNYSEDDVKFMNECNLIKDDIITDYKPTMFFIDKIKKNINKDILMTDQNNFKDWACKAGNKRIHVDFDGGVYAGSCRNVSLGNLNNGSETVSLIDSYTICAKDNCTCVDDIKSEKWSIKL
jgi:MoaA/NifB/PqqE/SkfB family radical SAM enzyme